MKPILRGLLCALIAFSCAACETTGGYATLSAYSTARSSGEGYAHVDDNPYRDAVDDPLSTFSIDVDTASYSNVRRFLDQNQLPPPDAVRVEEMINYFDYEYPLPLNGETIAVTTELRTCPWAAEHRLAMIGLKGRRLSDAEIPPMNLVFLVDVSGSMASANKLPLVKSTLDMLLDCLSERDRVAIVVYAGNAGLVLPSTAANEKHSIRRAIHGMEAGGSTAGGAGIQLAYRVAEENRIPHGANRVILCTDGDFNVGITDLAQLETLIGRQRDSGIYFTVLGYGAGNVKDDRMEMLADRGNGNYAYIDSLAEARKALVDQCGSTLITIADDVKVQVEFNPRLVKSYRLVGYENRVLENKDFTDDKKDAGEMGAGHTVTVLYELEPAAGGTEESGIPLRYQQTRQLSGDAPAGEWMWIKTRFRNPETRLITESALPIREAPRLSSGSAEPSRDFQLAAAAAMYGMLLRQSPHRGMASWTRALELARSAASHDPGGYRNEFIELIRKAESLTRELTENAASKTEGLRFK